MRRASKSPSLSTSTIITGQGDARKHGAFSFRKPVLKAGLQILPGVAMFAIGTGGRLQTTAIADEADRPGEGA